MSRDEDPLPNTPVPPAPEPESIDTMRPPPPAGKTDPAPAIPDRTDEILTKLEDLRKEAVQRDRALFNALVQLKSEFRDELNTKLDGQRSHFKHELDSAANMLAGAVEESHKELGQKIDHLTEEVRAGQQILNGVRSLAKSTYDMVASHNRQTGAGQVHAESTEVHAEGEAKG